MYSRLGGFISRWWPAVLAAWVVALVGVRWVAPRWEEVTRDGDFAYLPAEMTSAKGERLLERAFPDVLAKSQIVLVVARHDGPLRPEDLAVADRLVLRFSPADQESGPIANVISQRTEVVGQKLVSDPGEMGQALLILLQLRNEFMAIDNMRLLRMVSESLDELAAEPDFPPGLNLGVTGSAAIGSDMLSAAEESIRNTEWTTIALVLLILLAVYRAPGLVIVPLATIGVSVAMSTGLVALATQWCGQAGIDFKIFKTTKIFVTVILFGAGTDFCLFLIARYKEELQRGLAPPLAIQEALANVGGALVASALTTILGLGTLIFCDFGKFRNSGPAIALCLLVALAAALSLAPALLRAAGRAVFWPWGIGPVRPKPPGEMPSVTGENRPGPRGLSKGSAVWEVLSRLIIARPGLIFIGSLLLLLPIAREGIQTDITYDLLSELQTGRPSVRGTDLLRRHFPGGEVGPVTVLAYDPKGGLDTDEGLWQKIQPLADQLTKFRPADLPPHAPPPISTVRSLTAPLGDAKKTGLFGTIKDTMIRRHERTQSTYLAQSPEYAGKITRLDLVLRHDPFSIESIRTLDAVEDYLCSLAEQPESPWHKASFYFVGTTAGIRDLRAITASDLVLIQRLVPLAVLAVLIVLLRRPWICIYLILSVLLGYFVTIEITETFFRGLYGASYHGLDWKVPVFLFVILIAVGQDYNIYLVTRVFEEQRRRGVDEGMRVALVRTGGIITSCGLIMAGTFASMASGTLRAMHELGFALSLGILLDTFVIRTILVPAFLLLWERWSARKTSGDPPGEEQAELFPARRQIARDDRVSASASVTAWRRDS